MGGCTKGLDKNQVHGIHCPLLGHSAIHLILESNEVRQA